MKSEKKFKQPYKGYKWQKTSYVKYELGLIDELPFIVEGEDMPELRKAYRDWEEELQQDIKEVERKERQGIPFMEAKKQVVDAKRKRTTKWIRWYDPNKKQMFFKLREDN